VKRYFIPHRDLEEDEEGVTQEEKKTEISVANDPLTIETKFSAEMKSPRSPLRRGGLSPNRSPTRRM